MYRIMFSAFFAIGVLLLLSLWFCQKISKWHFVASAVCWLPAFFLTESILPGMGTVLGALTMHLLFFVIAGFRSGVGNAWPRMLVCLNFDLSLLLVYDMEQQQWQWNFWGMLVVLCILHLALRMNGEREKQWMFNLRSQNRGLYVQYFFLFWSAGLLIDIGLLLIVGSMNWKKLMAFCAAVAGNMMILAAQRIAFEKVRNVRQCELMSRWLVESRDYMNSIRAQRHDFNLHLHAISGLINSGQFSQCQRYVSGLVDAAGDMNDIMPIYDAVVGSMLYNMRRQAREQGTEIYYDIQYDMKDILCNGFECNKILGNLIQNGLDALTTDREKAYGIHVCIYKRNANTFMTISNLFEGDCTHLARAFEENYSGKRGHEGIGLYMVRKVLERNGGNIHLILEDDVVTFIVNVPNRISFDIEGGEHDKNSASG